MNLVTHRTLIIVALIALGSASAALAGDAGPEPRTSAALVAGGTPAAPALAAGGGAQSSRPSAAPPAPGHAPGRALALDADRDASRILAVTRRSGLFGFLGHEHAIVARDWVASLCMDPSNPKVARVSFMVRADSLVIDTPEARKEAVLDTGGPGPDDVRKIQARMLGPDALDTAKYPEIRFRSKKVSKLPGDLLEIEGDFTLHGQTRDIVVPVTYELTDETHARFSADFRVRQSEYGIEPTSIAGVVNVKDEVELRLRISAAFRSGGSAAKPAECSPPVEQAREIFLPGRSQTTQRY